LISSRASEAPSGHGCPAIKCRAERGAGVERRRGTLGRAKRPCEKQDKPTRHEYGREDRGAAKR
jgi:hypothetical protein